MKKKDFLLIGMFVLFGAIVSFGISKFLISGEKTIQTAEVVPVISGEFPETDKRYFNDKAFNPTQTITINDNQNTAPFESAQQ